MAQQILDAVRELPAGTRLPPERELTKRMGVGRSTVREALNGLAMMGVIEIRHGQGVFVAEQPSIAAGAAERSLPPREVTDELLEARRIVEVELARLAAERRTEEDLATMQGFSTGTARTWRRGAARSCRPRSSTCWSPTPRRTRSWPMWFGRSSA